MLLNVRNTNSFIQFHHFPELLPFESIRVSHPLAKLFSLQLLNISSSLCISILLEQRRDMVQNNRKQQKKQTQFIGSEKIGFAAIDVDYLDDVYRRKIKYLKPILEQTLNQIEAEILTLKDDAADENYKWHTYTVKRKRIAKGEKVTDSKVIKHFYEQFQDKKKETNLAMVLSGFCWSNSGELHYTVPAYEEYQYLKVVEETEGKKHHHHIRNYGSKTERGSYANSPDYQKWVEKFAARNAIRELTKMANRISSLLSDT